MRRKPLSRWLGVAVVIVGAASLPVTALAQSRTGSSAPSGDRSETSPDLAESAQVEIERVLEQTQRRATAAHRRYAAETAERARASTAARRDAQQRLVRVAQQLLQGAIRGSRARTPAPRAYAPAERERASSWEAARWSRRDGRWGASRGRSRFY